MCENKSWEMPAVGKPEPVFNATRALRLSLRPLDKPQALHATDLQVAAGGPAIQYAEGITGVKATLTFYGAIVVCEPAGLELLVSSSSGNSTWVAANVALRNGANKLTLLAPDGPAGCEQTLSAVRVTHKCPALTSWVRAMAYRHPFLHSERFVTAHC